MSEHEHDPDEPETPAEPEQEPEQPEPEQEPEQPEPDQEPETPSVEAQLVDIEAVFKKIETAFKAYTRKVGDAFGEEQTNLIPCPVCADTVPGFVDQRSVGQFPDDVRRNVMRFLGFAIEQEYEVAQTVTACKPCSAKGKVATGSTVPGHETITCPSCKGYGYVPPPGAGQIAVPGAEVVPFAPTVAAPVAPQEDVDEWGEPLVLPDGRENPNYGKMPHRKELVEPWGITAGLRATPEYVPVPGEVI